MVFLIGGKVRVDILQDMLKASYLKQKDREKEIQGYVLESFGNRYVAVYYNKGLNHCIVSFRGTAGTLTDWSYNATYAALGQDKYSQTKRAKAMDPILQKAIKKYGGENITIIGHSQGAIATRKNANKVNETITLNPAARFETQSKNEYTIRSSMDIVSSAQALGNNLSSILYPSFNKKRNTTIQSTTNNPLTEHSIDILQRLPQNKMIGKNKS
jgi:hypothetical protein